MDALPVVAICNLFSVFRITNQLRINEINSQKPMGSDHKTEKGVGVDQLDMHPSDPPRRKGSDV
jgi:hypothetical protein